ncbi:MAG: sulfite exporter TauE/SafE family protein, partial [Croceitalea sp.]|nr:sulfite exporter TauE/SafE family protein [Croceitalea sp.]
MAVFFGIALLYSAVGFGGGSSYLAILTLILTSFFVISSTALL